MSTPRPTGPRCRSALPRGVDAARVQAVLDAIPAPGPSETRSTPPAPIPPGSWPAPGSPPTWPERVTRQRLGASDSTHAAAASGT